MSRDTAIANNSDRGHVVLYTVRKWIANCDPSSPVGPEAERYLDFGLIRDRLDQRVQESAA
jgi:hypothetical protein